MSTSADITAKWEETVFSHADILAFTEKIWSRDVIGNQQVSCDMDRALYNGIINFVQFQVQRYRTDEVGGCESFKYQVEVRYYKEQLDDEETEILVESFFETLDDLIIPELGSRWGDLVSGFERDQTFPLITRVELDTRPVVGGVYRYFAHK